MILIIIAIHILKQYQLDIKYFCNLYIIYYIILFKFFLTFLLDSNQIFTITYQLIEYPHKIKIIIVTSNYSNYINDNNLYEFICILYKNNCLYDTELFLNSWIDFDEIV